MGVVYQGVPDNAPPNLPDFRHEPNLESFAGRFQPTMV